MEYSVWNTSQQTSEAHRATAAGLKNAKKKSRDKIIFRALNPTSNRALLYSDCLSQSVTYCTYITIKRFIAKADKEVCEKQHSA